MMQNKWTHILVWLSRITHCRGFGVQSPTDYGFVRYVINEHWPYYQYDEVGQDADWLTRRLGRLYFRLSNWRQPAVALVPACYQPFVKAGCRKVRWASAAEGADLLIVQTAAEVERLLSQCKADTVLVLDGLSQRRSLWRRIVESPSATITYDLYYCGIALFDPARTKQHYIVNF